MAKFQISSNLVGVGPVVVEADDFYFHQGFLILNRVVGRDTNGYPRYQNKLALPASQVQGVLEVDEVDA